MSDQHHVVQVLELQHRGHVSHHGVERDLSMVQMMTVPEASERRGPYLVATAPEDRSHPLPAPTPVPAAVYEHKCLSRTLLVACHGPPL